jgi:hypothetical protein
MPPSCVHEARLGLRLARVLPPLLSPRQSREVCLYQTRPPVIYLDVGYWVCGCADGSTAGGKHGGCALESQAAEKSLLPASYLDGSVVGQTQCHSPLLWSSFPLLWYPESRLSMAGLLLLHKSP